MATPIRTLRSIQSVVASGVLGRRIGEYQIRSTQDNFRNETSPDGDKWLPLAPSTRRRKTRNKDKILTESTRLRRSINYAVTDGGQVVRIGVKLAYARIHQYGGRIKLAARSRRVNFKIDRNGRSRFAKARNANFQQNVTFGASEITIPARPYLGVSRKDRDEIKEIVAEVVRKAKK